MTSFDGVPYGVITGDGDLPLPMPQEGSGISYYSARIRLDSRAHYIAFLARFSVVVLRPAIAILGGGTAIVSKGVGERELTYPDGPDERTVTAILDQFTPIGRFDGSKYLADARWLITEAID